MEPKTVHLKIKGLFPRQKEVFLKIVNTPPSEVKYHVVRASRKSGKTHMLHRLLFWYSIKYPGSEIGMMSASWSFTQNFFRDFLKLVPKQLIKKSNIGETIEFTNGAIIDFYTAASKVLPVNRSFDFFFLDEFALYSKDVWTYVKPCVLAKKDARVIVTSTPRGKNAFFDMCQQGIKNENRHAHYRMHYTDNPKIDLQDIEETKKTTPIALFNQEYEAEFTQGMSGVFGDFKKNMLILDWIQPEQGRFYFFAIDVSGDGKDKTILTIIDDLGRIVLIVESKYTDLVEQAEELEPYIRKYKARGYVEKNGIGKGLCDIMKKDGIDVTPLNTTNESKQNWITNVLILLNKMDLKLPSDKLCPQLENEMSCFGGTRLPSGLIKYEGEDGVHDDYVMSLLMAVEARRKFRSGVQQIYTGASSLNDDDQDQTEFDKKYTRWVNSRHSADWSKNLYTR